MVPAHADEQLVAAFVDDGAVCLRGAFSDWVDVLASGVARQRSTRRTSCCR
jgi:hypothetical protein